MDILLRCQVMRPAAHLGRRGTEEKRGCPDACAGVRFFRAAAVQDPDDPDKHYAFDLAGNPAHCACFNMGTLSPADGSPVISWSDLRAFYRLPDGTAWAEHGYFHDAEDMARPCTALP